MDDGAQTIKASGSIVRRPSSIPQWFPRLQHIRDPILRLAHADQRKKSFAFQIEQVTFGHSRLMIQIAACQNARELLANQRIVIRNESGSLHLMNAQLERRE